MATINHQPHQQSMNHNQHLSYLLSLVFPITGYIMLIAASRFHQIDFRAIMQSETTQKRKNIIQRANHIRTQFLKEGQPYRLSPHQISQMIATSALRQKQLAILSESQPKTISKYFLKFEPLSFNPANFKDIASFGGPKIAFNNNRMYVGSIVDGKRHGKGVIASAQGKIYEGEMANNERNGVGVEIYEQGNFYVGEFRGNKRHGKGSMVWLLPEGKYHYYKGNWNDGQPNGYGLHSSEGGQYWGEFKTGVRSGKGIQITSRHIFQGHFTNGVREGQGFLYEENVQYYEGEFRLGLRHGYGKWLSLKTCEQYEGFFQNDKKDGIGFYQRPNGFAYRGLFTQDKPSGTGEVLRMSRDVSRQRSKSKESKSNGRIRTQNKGQTLRQTVEMKSNQLSKQPQSRVLLRKQSQQLPQNKPHLFGSAATIKQRPPLNPRKYLSSAKLFRTPQAEPAECPQDSRGKCKKKSCSCNKWDERSSQPSKVDESRLKRLFSSRKMVLRQVL